MLCLLAWLFFAALLHGAEEENAPLEATVLPGELTIAPSSVSGPFTPITGTGTTTNADQVDAVRFRLNRITVQDANSDGLGFRLTAAPGNLTRVGFTGGGPGQTSRNTLTVGTVTGFVNSSEPANTNTVDPNTLVYLSGAGVVLEVDYELAYTIPKQATMGDYAGVISFALIAE